MRARSVPVVLLLILAALSAAGTAAAQNGDQKGAVDKGCYAYKRARQTKAPEDYAEADQILRGILDPQTGILKDKVFINDAMMCRGATLVGMGKTAEAVELFEKIVRSDRSYEPDPAVFPAQVATVFFDARTSAEEKIRKDQEEEARRAKERREQEAAAAAAQVERMKALEKLATQDHVVEVNRRLIALLPFGVGQFQNGKNGLGWFFLSTEALLVAGTLVTGGIYLAQYENAQAANQSLNSFVAQQYLDRVDQARTVNLLFNGALLATYLAGVIEAEVTFVPAFSSVRPRPLPKLPGTSPDAPAPPGGSPAPRPAVSWSFGASPLFTPEGRDVAGAYVGVGGRF